MIIIMAWGRIMKWFQLFRTTEGTFTSSFATTLSMRRLTIFAGGNEGTKLRNESHFDSPEASRMCLNKFEFPPKIACNEKWLKFQLTHKSVIDLVNFSTWSRKYILFSESFDMIAACNALNFVAELNKKTSPDNLWFHLKTLVSVVLGMIAANNSTIRFTLCELFSRSKRDFHVEREIFNHPMQSPFVVW